MAANVEQLSALERRLQMSVPVAGIEKEIDERLKKLARSAKMPGFRPGKVPMKVLAQTYGPQLRSEVLGDAVRKSFADAVREANLRVAGQPRIEPRQDAAAGALEFNATFEVYPEVKLGDVGGAKIERPAVTVDDAAIERTLELLRKQRVTYEPAARAAADGDRITVDFAGTLDGTPFAGGAAEGLAFVLGEGRMLAEFEGAARGMQAGETRAFDVSFPAAYPGRDVAGKTAQFTLTLRAVEAPRLPEVDAEFAKTLGVADGDLSRMRADVRQNVEREVAKRIEARIKQQALQVLLTATPLELPRSLVAMETRELVERAAADLRARGLKFEKMPVDPQAFETSARQRVALGLIIAELARAEKLQPKPAEVRTMIEREAQSYESPAEVVKWFYMQPQRLAEMESLALEANVVNWVLGRAQVSDQATAFDELMEGSA
ncbi:MAG: trigger factor [Burkholderiales bacterium]